MEFLPTNIAPCVDIISDVNAISEAFRRIKSISTEFRLNEMQQLAIGIIVLHSFHPSFGWNTTANETS
jgi:hypothetical protein